MGTGDASGRPCSSLMRIDDSFLLSHFPRILELAA